MSEYEKSQSKEDFWDWLKVNHPKEFDNEDRPKVLPKLSFLQRIINFSSDNILRELTNPFLF